MIENSALITRGKRVGWVVKGKVVKYMLTEEDLTLGGGHIVRYADDIELYT